MIILGFISVGGASYLLSQQSAVKSEAELDDLDWVHKFKLFRSLSEVKSVICACETILMNLFIKLKII